MGVEQLRGVNLIFEDTSRTSRREVIHGPSKNEKCVSALERLALLCLETRRQRYFYVFRVSACFTPTSAARSEKHPSSLGRHSNSHASVLIKTRNEGEEL